MRPIPTYDFDILELLKKGYAKTEGVKGIFLAAFGVYVIVALAVQMILEVLFPPSSVPSEPNFLNQLIVTVFSMPALMPLLAGIIMLAIGYARGDELHFKSIFKYYPYMGNLALAGLLVYLMTLIGFMLLVLPGIYLSVAYVFTIPLIVDRGMDVWDAMERSRKTVTQHWFKIFGLTFLLGIGMVAGVLTFGIGLIWAVPLVFVTLYGLLYPMIFDKVEI